MARVNESISMYSGESRIIRDTILNADNNNEIMDLTGYTAKFIIHNKGNIVVQKDLTNGMEIQDPESGVIEIRLLPADTINLSGTYSFEVQLKRGIDERVIVTLGRISITKAYS